MFIRHVNNLDDWEANAYGKHEFYIHGPTSEMTDIKIFARVHKARCYAWKQGRKKSLDIHILRTNDDTVAMLFKLTFIG